MKRLWPYWLAGMWLALLGIATMTYVSSSGLRHLLIPERKSDRPSGGPAQAALGLASTVPAYNSNSTGTKGFSKNELLLVEMARDSWLEVPNSAFLDSGVCKDVGGVEGCGAVIEDWSGGAYDPIHQLLLIWGGGHDGYWGNEVYAFNPGDFSWSRITKPSAVSGHNQDKDPLDDGRPVTRHTYDQLAYLAHVNRFWARGGSIARSGNSTVLTWTLDLDKQVWENRAPATEPYPTTFGTFAGASAYDPKTGQVYLQTIEGLQSYDYESNSWKRLIAFNNPPYWPRYAIYGPKRGAIDLKRRLFWGLGSGSYFIWDIDAAKVVTDAWVTQGGGIFDTTATAHPGQVIKTGGGDIIAATAPGVDYEPNADALVAWKGGAPYVLDLKTKTWSIKSGLGAPTKPVNNGTYGRFRYIEKYNVFILVNRPTDNVFFYKLTAGLSE